MKRSLPLAFLALLCVPWFSPLSLTSIDAQDESFASFLETWEQAQVRFINGDPTEWKRHTSHRDDVTILGGFGGEGEKGWAAVGARYDWASAQYRPSQATMRVDYHNVVVSGDLAVTVGIERQQGVRVGPQREGVGRALRVTQVFRREADGWKLVHRHADQMTDRQDPSRGDARD